MPSPERPARAVGRFEMPRQRSTWTERIRTAGLAAAVAPVVILVGQLTVRAVGQAIRDAPKLLVPGTPAPPLGGAVLVRAEGEPDTVAVRRLADYRGEVVVLAFYSTGCAPCRVAMPELTDLAREYRGRGLRVLAVNLEPRGMEADARRYLAAMGAHIEAVLDTAGDSRAYNVFGVPTFYVIDRAGVIRAHTEGLNLSDYHIEWVRPSGRALLDSLLAGSAAPVALSSSRAH